MDEPTVLRETKMGQRGFVKEDVMTYLDELNSKIITLEDSLKKAEEKGPADPQELVKYRNQVDNLQEKLNASNNALRAAKKELDEAKKQIEDDQKLINQLKAGGPGAAAAAAQSNAQTVAALEAAKKEIEKLKAQLAESEKRNSAAAAPQPNSQANAQAAALEAAKREIDNLRNQLKAAEQKNISSASNTATAAAANAASSAELAKANQEITRINSELQAKTKELADKAGALEAKNKEFAGMESKLAQLNKDNAAEIAKKDAEIKRLNGEIETLKESASDPTAQMGMIFAEAQKTVSMLKTQAKLDAENTTNEANEKAAKILSEANEQAEKAISNANIAAETCIREANEQAKSTVDGANKEADRINEMSSTVKNMLLNEIESINTKFNDITSVLGRLTTQANDRMSEAQLIIGEARKSVEPSDKSGVKRAEAPKADFKAATAPKASIADLNNASSTGAASDPFADLASNQFASRNGNSGYNSGKPSFNSNNNKNNVNNYNKPAAPPPASQQSKPAKKTANFNFDMAELLKAAEEEAAKENNSEM